MKIKNVINKVIFSILFLSFYTYLIIHFTTMRMIKTEAANNMISYGLIQKLLEENKSIESFLNSNIKIDIALYNQSSLKFSNPMELHYTLSAFGDIERICSDILKNSNNTDIKEFVKNSCEMEKK